MENEEKKKQKPTQACQEAGLGQKELLIFCDVNYKKE